ncbi:MAG: PQQ-dependent sugar dehydrogenase [Bacteroidota bacterium]
MKNFTLGLLCICLNTICFSQDLELQLFASGLDRPVNIKHAGDDRLFVIEQDGYIRIISSNGTLQTQPFLDIDDRVFDIGGIGDERGLLGLAFHPNYATNGFFYVNYINDSGNTVISRFTRDAVNFSQADPDSEFVILTITQPFTNHNGGDMAFGADGFLYIATGDGGSGGDPDDRAQDLGDLHGKILRIDVDNTANGNNYAIPAGNPFISNAGALDEIWAYGLRNPWKFSFDRLTNDLWIGDVGQGQIEEINRVDFNTSGQNYGWRCYEGSSTFNTLGCPAVGTLTFPVAEYDHFNDGLFKCSITGGYRYRGTTYPNFQGLYFFADYCSDEIGYLTPNGSAWDITLEQFSSNNWTAFGEDNSGELYIAGITSGNIFRLIDASLSIDENSLSSVTVYPNPASSNVNISTSGTSIQLNKINIYSTLGKLVKTVTPNTSEINTIEISDLSQGLYILELQASNGESRTQKLVIN